MDMRKSSSQQGARSEADKEPVQIQKQFCILPTLHPQQLLIAYYISYGKIPRHWTKDLIRMAHSVMERPSRTQKHCSFLEENTSVLPHSDII